MTAEQALHKFWSSFGLKAYDESSVPSGTEFPYLTYETAFAVFNDATAVSISLWYKDTSWSGITAKTHEIAKKTHNGINIPHDDGVIFLVPANPFYQRVADEDDTIRRIVFNFYLS